MNNTVTFPQPDKTLNLNDRLHWRTKASRTRAWRTAANVAATAQLGRTAADRSRPPSLVRVTFPVTQNRRRDAANWHATTKPIVDGLVDAGVWPDDNDDWVIELNPRFDKGSDLVVVELSPRARLDGAA